MGLNKAQASKIEAKAKAMDNASEGMRLLLDNGYKVAEVAKIMDKPYGWVYGVADRHGAVETAAARRAPAKAGNAAQDRSARVSGQPRKARTAKTPPARVVKVSGRKAEPKSASAKVAARLKAAKVAAPAKKTGRPSATRRQANRKVRVAK